MASPKRDKYKPSGGKMLDSSDAVFDVTAWIKSIGVSILTAFKIKNIAGNEINPATKEDQDDIESNQTDGSQKTQIVTLDSPVGTQNPFPTDGDSVYSKDIWVEESDIGDFSGAITDLFDGLHTVITNTTSNDPKEILIHFDRTTPTIVLGMGAYSGNFSNVKIIAMTSGHIEMTLVDESASDTKYTSRQFDVPTVGFNAIKIQFHTTDTVTLSNLFIAKSRSVVSRIQGEKPDGNFTEFQATQQGNFKISMEEVDGQLKDDITGVMNVIDFPHHEIHEGDHYYVEGFLELDDADEYYVKLVTPDTAKWGHFRWEIESNGILETNLYEGASGGMTGGAVNTPLNNNRNSSNVSGLVITGNVTVATSKGLKLSSKKVGGVGFKQVSGGDVAREDEIVLKQNETYFREFISGSDANVISFKATWYEHTNI